MARIKPLRFATDTNFLITLALAKFLERDQFFEYHKQYCHKESIYEDVLWLEKMIDAGRIEIIVPANVHKEFLDLDKVYKSRKNKMSKKEIASREAKKELRVLMNRYMKKCPSVKRVLWAMGTDKRYTRQALHIAMSYSEQQMFPDNLKLSMEARSLPFLLHSGNPCSDAMIMAEATMMGLDLISFDHHIIGKEQFDVAATIQKINQSQHGSDVRPYNFSELIDLIRPADKNLLEINPNFRRGKGHTPLVKTISFVDHGDFMQAIYYRNDPLAHGIALENQKIDKMKTLFSTYLEVPLDVEENRGDGPARQAVRTASHCQ